MTVSELKETYIAEARTESFLKTEEADLARFKKIVESTSNPADYPLASSIAVNRVPVYDCESLRKQGKLNIDPNESPELADEFIKALRLGPGIVVFKKVFTDHKSLDKSTESLMRLIETQRSMETDSRNSNYIVPNTCHKMLVDDPEAYTDYFANDVLALVSQSWLGPYYQMTAQISQCLPGNEPQDPHRDYHIGVWRDINIIKKFPTHVHLANQTLTLQGAVAHCDMPLESGPTRFLPFSQLFAHGYLGSGGAIPGLMEYFEENKVQLPLEKGDAIFFNPSLFHAASKNVSKDINRIANLLQVNSAFGRTMDAVDRPAMCKAVYPTLLKYKKESKLNSAELFNVVTSTADGYTFPTNARNVNNKKNPPQAQLLWDCLQSELSPEEVNEKIDEHFKATWQL